MYNLDEKEAAKADAGQSKYINESGKYIGKITSAELVNSKAGAKGIKFSFSTGEQKANNISIWTHGKENGKELFGLKQVYSIMSVLGVKTLQPKKQEVDVFDFETKTQNKRIADTFPDLCRDIGLVLENEPYVGHDGSERNSMKFVLAFCAKTGLSAAERQEGVVIAKAADAKLQYILANPKKAKASTVKPSASIATASTEEYDIDIPF